MITYTLPDFTAGLGLNLYFARLLAAHPEWAIEGVRIGSVYGCFPGCIFNGGRAYLRDPYTPEQMERTFSTLDEYGLEARLTLTNMLIEPKHLSDTHFLSIMEAARGHRVGAIVYSEAVDAFLRERHPGMHRTLSTTREILDVEELNEATRAFDMVVLNYEKHRDQGFLRRIEQPAKVEVMVNEFCHVGCPHRQEHYLRNSQDQIGGVMRPFACVQPPSTAFFRHEPNHPVILTNDDVRRMHDEYGFENFKIVGRGVVFATVLEALVYYLVRPEYREVVKRDVARQMRR